MNDRVGSFADRAEQFVRCILTCKPAAIDDYAKTQEEKELLILAQQRAERAVARLRKTGLQVGGPWEPGEVLNRRFKVVRRLGAGGMGEVFLLRQLEDGREFAGCKEFAAKRLRNQGTCQVLDPVRSIRRGSQQGQLLFLAEILRSLRVNPHPNVLHCESFDILDGGLVLFTRHMHRGNLADAIDRKQNNFYGEPVPSHVRFVCLALQVLAGMAHLHRHGVIHQDIKPENILVRRLGADTWVLVADFGVARQTVRDSSGVLRPIAVAGLDRRYASPEQLAGEAVDDRTDVFSWAKTLLTVTPGTTARQRAALLRECKPSQIPRLLPSNLDRSLRQQLLKTVTDCLEPHPANRPTAAQAFDKLAQLHALPQAVIESLHRDSSDGTPLPPASAWDARATARMMADELLARSAQDSDDDIGTYVKAMHYVSDEKSQSGCTRDELEDMLFALLQQIEKMV